jgi:hypothetical protein
MESACVEQIFDASDANRDGYLDKVWPFVQIVKFSLIFHTKFNRRQVLLLR